VSSERERQREAERHRRASERMRGGMRGPDAEELDQEFMDFLNQ